MNEAMNEKKLRKMYKWIIDGCADEVKWNINKWMNQVMDI